MLRLWFSECVLVAARIRPPLQHAAGPGDGRLLLNFKLGSIAAEKCSSAGFVYLFCCCLLLYFSCKILANLVMPAASRKLGQN